MIYKNTLTILLMCSCLFVSFYYITSDQNKKINHLTERVNTLQLDSKEVQLTRQIVELQPNIEHDTLIEYKDAIMLASKKWKISPILLASVVFRESSFKQYSKGSKLPSGTQCIGPMQIHPHLHKEKLASRGITSKNELFNISINIDIGAEILKEILERYNYNVKRSLMAYVGGSHQGYVNDILNVYVKFDI